jgi:site-specific recombinase XerC
VIRGHILARRADPKKPGLVGATIRRKLTALTSQYDYLCWANTVVHNPVKGVKRPKVECYEDKTQVLGDVQARATGSATKRHVATEQTRRRFCTTCCTSI